MSGGFSFDFKPSQPTTTTGWGWGGSQPTQQQQPAQPQSPFERYCNESLTKLENQYKPDSPQCRFNVFRPFYIFF